MRLGLHVPQAGPRSSVQGALDVARAAEELGIDSLWLFDHLIGPTALESRYPGSHDGTYSFQPTFPYLEATAMLGALAVATRRVRLGTRVLVSILRQPVVLAKQLASIDAIAGGRLVLGVGTGWMKEEFDAVGVAMSERLSRLDEHTALMTSAWRDGVSAFTGRFYEHVEAGFYPQPPQPGQRIPILLGGFRDAVLRRVARYGDGWAVHTPPGAATEELGLIQPAQLAERIETLKRYCDELGRDFAELEIVTGGRLTSDAADLEAHARLGVSTCALVSFAPPDAIVDRAARLVATVGSEI